MRLDAVLDAILHDLPWVDHYRLVVGPLASRETVKDVLLDQAGAIPSWAVVTLSELAAEYDPNPKERALSQASRCDALERVGAAGFFQKAAPELSRHLKARQVSAKIARFLTELDRFYANPAELEALIEHFRGKDAQLAAFLEVVASLWAQGELQPWGEGSVFRRAIEALEQRSPATSRRKKIYLWGFAELTPLEETFLKELARYEDIERLEPEPTSPALRAWNPHSVWDELLFLREELAALQSQGIVWRDIAIFVPQDALYKRLVRKALHSWNVPLLDPTLSDAAKDQPEWMWWQEFLRIIASGLKLDDIRAWIGPEGKKDFLDAAYQSGVHGGAAQWERTLEKHPLPELKLLVEGLKVFGRMMSPKTFLLAAQQISLRAQELVRRPGEVLVEFAHHLCEERPYLDSANYRLARYLPLFEEFLQAKSRQSSLRCDDGVRFIAHGVWLPTQARHAFILGSNAITRATPTYDLWDWENLEVKRAWEKLHSGSSWAERLEREEKFLAYGLFAHENVTVSSVAHDLKGEPWPHGILHQKFLPKEIETTREGGHDGVGWVAQAHAKAVTVLEVAEARPDLFAQLFSKKPMKVSIFEDYLKCPLLFYGRHVLKLEDERELGLDPNAAARGKVLHRVLERFIKAEIEGEKFTSLEQAKIRIKALIDEEVSSRALPGLYRHKPLVEKARHILLSHATKWVEWEFENRRAHPNLKPFAVEAAVEVDLGLPIKFSGRIDRVDSDGENAVVIDYKSGSANFIGKELLAGTGAQLLMYLKGTEKTMGLKPAGAYYLSLKGATKVPGGVFLKEHIGQLYSAHPRNSGVTATPFPTLFEKVAERWSQAAQDLVEGKFNPAPARPAKDCTRCQLRSVCSYYKNGEPIHE